MERKIKLAALLAIILVTTIVLLMFKPAVSSPTSGAKLYVSPSKVEDPTLAPSSTFWINITVYNVTNMLSCEFNMSFTPGIFVTSTMAAQPIGGVSASPFIDNDDTLGYLYVKLTYRQPITVFEKDAVIFRVQYTVTNYGFTVLNLHNTTLKDSSSNLIPHEVQGGYVSIIKHDIAVTAISTSTNETYAGRSVNITVTLQNYGNIAENFTATILAGTTNLTDVKIDNLQPNETRTITYTWNTTGFSASMTAYAIKAQAQILPYETNTTNNFCVDGQVKLKLVGDVNGDGKVDIQDLIFWDTAFNSKLGDANWNPQADINGDGIVDKQDGTLIVQNYRSSL